LTQILERFHRAESQTFEPEVVVKIKLDNSLKTTGLKSIDFSQTVNRKGYVVRLKEEKKFARRRENLIFLSSPPTLKLFYVRPVFFAFLLDRINAFLPLRRKMDCK